MSDSRILVIDNEALMRTFACETLNKSGYEVKFAECGAQAIEMLSKENYGIVFTDIKMPDMSGIDILNFVLERSPDTPVVIMTAYARLENAFEAVKLGAMDYIIKPFSPNQIEAIVSRINERRHLMAENRLLREKIDRNHGFGEIIGQSEKMLELRMMVKKAGESDKPLLITGEKGTGKELIARAIHKNSKFAFCPFIKVDCADISDDFFDKEFCGLNKKESTNSIRLIKKAKRKTFLFDEIDKMPRNMQIRLAEILSDSGAESLTGKRIICTLIINSEEGIERKHINKELFGKIGAVHINILPLRERLDDVPLLAEYFIREYCGMNGIERKTLSKIAITRLMAYSWMGNVGELKNAVQRAIALSSGSVIQPEQILPGEGDLTTAKLADESKEIIGEAAIPLWEMERRLILKTLKSLGGNRGMTAEALKISVRTVRNKLNQYREMGALFL